MSRVVLLRHAASSVTSARRGLCSDLRACGVAADTVDDAAIVLSELLSNALRHAAPLPEPFPSECVRVSWDVGGAAAAEARDGWLEVAVCDGGAQTLPRLARPSVSALGGRGLGIVENIAAKWGTEVDDRVTTVWAVLEAAVPPGRCVPGTRERTPGSSGAYGGDGGARVAAAPRQQAASA
ncbi:ATP-binding protein [Streptomonospora salina]|uniref:Anti-sigma regulatory factor (Ser/Thr protein kinase) n=1 Tax=Streptomonospora salina TaxID=104205 RepID=A0A841E790_9ACTN|nr:ATP-binding protein [Streptomonospora salina]MBB5998876.1 anti-sigma regulatory factor (Ser/Thr protein kinase) [Streptomonospora salina]